MTRPMSAWERRHLFNRQRPTLGQRIRRGVLATLWVLTVLVLLIAGAKGAAMALALLAARSA